MPEIIKKKVIISDLDGTLLNNSHVISEFTIQAFQQLHREGYLVIIATGRHHLDALPIIKNLEIPVYLVSSNGARIHSPEKELLFAFDLQSDAVKSILDLNIDPEITIVLFKELVWQTNRTNEKLNHFQTEMNYVPEIVNFDNLVDLSGIKLFFSHENHQKLIDLKDLIMSNNASFNYAFSLPICLEFMDKSVDKSVAISRILELENCSYTETVVFGDGFNDEKMLVSAGTGLLMNNAPFSLKEKLSHLEVISSNNEDGVAHYLSQKILEKWL
jgi:Cof subfamily protein (haloacid dehalogenase superfamily)